MRLDAADAGQVDVHQDHVRQVGAGELDAEVAVGRAQQAQVGPARDQLLDQLQVGRIVLDIEQRAQRRAVGQPAAVAAARRLGLVAASCGAAGQAQLDPEHAAHADRALHADGAAHQLDQALGHHQADAGAFLRAGLLAEPVEGLEQLRELLRRQARRRCRATLMRIALRAAAACTRRRPCRRAGCT